MASRDATFSKPKSRVRSPLKDAHSEKNLIRECQTDFKKRLQLTAPDVYLVPPDLGGQLYQWWQEKRNGTTLSAPERRLNPPPTHSTTRSFPEAEVAPQEGRGELRDRSLLKRPHLSPSTSQNSTKRPRTISEAPSAGALVESVSDIKVQKIESTSHSENQIPPTSLQQASLDGNGKDVGFRISRNSVFPFRPASPIDDEQLSSIHEKSRTRPTDFPKAWEKAHPADKMLFSMARKGVEWPKIADRWKEMTGHSDKARHLKWRYEVIEKTMGLQSIGSADDLVEPDAASQLHLSMSSDIARGWRAQALKGMQASATSADGTAREAAVEMAFESKPDPESLNKKNHSVRRNSNGTFAPRRKGTSHDTGSKTKKERTPIGQSHHRKHLEDITESRAPSNPPSHVKAESDLNRNQNNVTPLFVKLVSETKDEKVKLMGPNPPSRGMTSRSTIGNTNLRASVHRVPTKGRPSHFIRLNGEVAELRDSETERRRRLSEALRATWVKRQAEGRNGRYGEMPKVSMIVKAEQGGRELD